MLLAFFVVLVTLCILLFAEYLARAKSIHAELTRKLVHVTVGTFVGFWPFFLSWHEIQLLGLAFLVVISVSIKLNIFHSIHAVDRNIFGELFYAIVICLLAFFVHKQWIFMAAMLNLSLSDGFAAVSGLLWGKSNRYKVFGRTKSVAGTTTFVIISFIILLLYVTSVHPRPSLWSLAWLPFVAAAAENLAVYGADNLVIPLLIAAALGGF